MTHKVYFVAGNGRIKIGTSGNRPTRINQLQSQVGFPLTLIGEIDGSRSEEQEIHRHLSFYRMDGEWFRDCEELREAIAVILRDGEFLNEYQRRVRETARREAERELPWLALKGRLDAIARPAGAEIILQAARYRHLMLFTEATGIWFGKNEGDQAPIVAKASADIAQVEAQIAVLVALPTWNVADAYLRGAA